MSRRPSRGVSELPIATFSSAVSRRPHFTFADLDAEVLAMAYRYIVLPSIFVVDETLRHIT